MLNDLKNGIEKNNLVREKKSVSPKYAFDGVILRKSTLIEKTIFIDYYYNFFRIMFLFVELWSLILCHMLRTEIFPNV